jgi:C-terminal processing protease CtpA/Prc
VKPSTTTDSGHKNVNEWIRSQLEGWYYWNDVVKATPPVSGELAYDEYLERTILSLPWASVQDTSHKESPPTIDGEWNETFTARLDGGIYSYIERTPVSTRGTRAASESMEVTFGFGFQVVRLVDGRGVFTGRYMFLVSWVRDGSPAYEAGLRRGVWITKYDGAEITYDRYVDFWNRMYTSESGAKLSFSVDTNNDRIDDDAMSLTAVEMKVSPILFHDVIPTAGGNKVAYLFYNGFENGENGEFDTELRNVFGDFKSRGATHLVLDLRYNPGGYVSSCRMLTNLAARVSTSDVFIQMVRNKDIRKVYNVDNPQVVKFSGESNSLGFDKVYVLATIRSASASEMVISSIRGVLGDGAVVHIGDTTGGKNVGMDIRETTIDGYDYTMWPITFKILNAVGFTDYAGGLKPDYRINELRDVLTLGGVLHQLGDPDERLLRAALTLIDGGRVYSDSSTRVSGAAALGEPVSTPPDPRRGGAKYIPFQ